MGRAQDGSSRTPAADPVNANVGITKGMDSGDHGSTGSGGGCTLCVMMRQEVEMLEDESWVHTLLVIAVPWALPAVVCLVIAIAVFVFGAEIESMGC